MQVESVAHYVPENTIGVCRNTKSKGDFISPHLKVYGVKLIMRLRLNNTSGVSTKKRTDIGSVGNLNLKYFKLLVLTPQFQANTLYELLCALTNNLCRGFDSHLDLHKKLWSSSSVVEQGICVSLSQVGKWCEGWAKTLMYSSVGRAMV